MGLDMITISSEKINLEKGYANSEEVTQSWIATIL